MYSPSCDIHELSKLPTFFTVLVLKTKGEIMNTIPQRPSNAFIGVSWLALTAGITAFLIGLWNAEIVLHEKGYYFAVLLYGLFAAVSVQKSVRDQLESVPVTAIYLGLSWASVITAIVLLSVGLWNAGMSLSEKGFYAMAFSLALFAAIAVQKNTRDVAASERSNPQQPTYEETSTAF